MPASLAYLVTREGSKWTDVFRLVPGQVVTIGRAPSNRIVLKDERCSRFHAELSCRDDHWLLKDLDSRNGTSVGERFVKGEVPLEPGDIIRVGNTQLAFVNDLSQAFPDNSQLVKTIVGAKGGNPSLTPDPDELSAYEPTTITHRRKETKFLAPADADELSVGGAPKEGIVAARLLRLAFELAKAADPTSVAKLAIAGLMEGAPVDAAGVLLMKRYLPKDAKPTELATFAAELEMLASRSATATPYHRVSPFLAAQVLGTGEAVLARNVLGDSTLGIRDSKGTSMSRA